jgi:hypothetical protein
MLILFFLVSVLIAEPITGAELTQQYFPRLEGHIQAEQAKIKAKQDYFNGDIGYRDAFLDLKVSPLLSPSFLQARLIVLQKQALEREEERFQQTSIDAEPNLITKYEQLVDQYLYLQSQNQALEERFLHSLLMQLNSHPNFREQEFEKRIQPWVSFRDEIDVEEGDTQLLAESNQQEQKLRLLKDDIIVHFSVVGSTQLSDRITSELEDLQSESHLEVKGSIERLQLILLLVSDQRIEDHLEQLRQKNLEHQRTLIQRQQEQVKKDWTIQGMKEGEVLALKNVLMATNNTLDINNEIDQIQLDINNHKLEIIQTFLNQQELKAQKIEDELIASQQKLSEAKKLQEQGELKNKQIQDLTVSIREDETKIREEESNRRNEITEFIATCQKDLDNNQKQGVEALDKPPMDPDKQKAIDTVYTNWHTLIIDIQMEIRGNQHQAVEINQYNKLRLPELQRLNEQHQGTGTSEAALKEAINDLQIALLDRTTNIINEELALISILIKAKKKRKELFGEVSTEAKKSIQKDFWMEVESELEETKLTLHYRWNELKTSILSTDFHFETISIYFKRLLLLILALIFWREIRHRAYGVFTSLQKKLRTKQLNIGSLGDFELWKGMDVVPIKNLGNNQLLSSIIDILALVLYLQFYSQFNDLITGFVYLTLLILAWRLCRPLVLLLLDEEKISLPLVNGLQALVLCVLGFKTLDFMISEIFLAYRISELLIFTQTIVLWVLLIHQLGTWSHLIQQYAMNTVGSQKLKQWMQSNSTGILGNRLRAIIGLLILFVRGVYFLSILLMENSELLGSALARRTLQHSSSELDPPDQTVLDAFTATNKKEVLFEKEIVELNDIFLEWREDRKRGMISIIGDHGVGKSKILLKASTNWKRENTVHNIWIQKRETSVEAMLSMIQRQFKIEAETPSDLIEAMLELPSMIICIDDFQRCMLRDVGGYDAIQFLLSIMQGTAHQHFWVTTFHLHSWTFLHSASTPVNLSVFRQTIRIKPLHFMQVKNWIIERCKIANIQLDFSEISPIANDDSLRRAKLSFWRLLTEFSKGNPSVIEQFWLSAMRKGDDERTVKIVLFAIPDEFILDKLTDTEAFILANLLIHNDISLSLLQRSLNIPLSRLQSACRNLQGLGLIKKQETFEVHDWWWPIVERYLVKKRMIYLE